jgi:hypothetical protein
VLEMSLWSVGGRSVEWTILRETMLCLADVEVSSAKTKVCDCKIYTHIYGINKSAIITKKRIVNKSAKLQGA